MKFDYVETSILGCESIYRLSKIAGMSSEPVLVKESNVLTWRYAAPEKYDTIQIGTLRNPIQNTLALDLGWWKRRKEPVVLMGPEGSLILERRVNSI